ncbi:peptide MFS transporter [Herbiconiux flava]|uniref:POT family proton-dependent oligopeptide transporter n=1 Tax=Herbiconiux flava TaxID=881268 RepID=A0A852SR80_9MICO|nr:oligopeptide:H+ symporter [Herbiconiux flava]NYD71379.1 POT family proton-dependent oligopeptide transporter [Herbiconiux flava]GLK18657.1 MFS transporter [Herbiconiux flava]
MTETVAAKERTFFGQPFSLVHVFGVEMWERFSFYGMQGILLLYMFYSVAEGGLDIPKPVAVGIIGAYGGSVYLATILGAWVADRLLGSERTLFFSAIVVMAGHIALSLLPGLVGLGAGLILIALGSGGVKANATSVVGTLYTEKDPRRDAGFSIFYLGINLGAFFGPLLTGLLQTTAGFHWGFGLAAVGMAIGLTQYAFGRRSLPAESKEVPNPLPTSHRVRMGLIGVAAIVLIVVLVVVGVLTADNLADAVALVTLAASIAYFVVILSSSRITATERKRVFSFIPMFITSVAFWALYQQQFTVVTIYANDRLDLNLFGGSMPVAWVQSINPIFIIILSGVFAAIWSKLGSRQPPTPFKFAAAAIVMGIAFLLFIPFSGTGAHGTPLIALVGILFVFTIAELLLSPVGLALSTRLAPKVFRTQMVALFFLSIALGTALSGILAKLYDENDEVPYFGISGLVAIVVGVLLVVATPWVRKLMVGVR